MADARHTNEEDPRDEDRLADLVSAGMWTTAGLVGAAMFALPGSTHEHLGAGLAVAGGAVPGGHRRRVGGQAAAQAPPAARRGRPGRQGPARPAAGPKQPPQ